MMSRWTTIALLACAIAACGDRSGPDPLIEADAFSGPVVATVNGDSVPADLLQAYLRMSGKIDQRQLLKGLTED